jgi:hypothetical protein
MSEFKITVGSNIDYEDLIAEIYYGEEFVALISQEDGYERLDVELYAPVDGGQFKFKLSEFEQAVAKAKRRLFELRKSIT